MGGPDAAAALAATLRAVSQGERRRRWATVAAIVVAVVLAAGGAWVARSTTEVLTVAGSVVVDVPAGREGVVARHGDDSGSIDGGAYLLCDREADHNRVRAELNVATTAGETRTVRFDRISSLDSCTRAPVGGRIVAHRICELNHLRWSCGNWQAPE